MTLYKLPSGDYVNPESVTAISGSSEGATVHIGAEGHYVSARVYSPDKTPQSLVDKLAREIQEAVMPAYPKPPQDWNKPKFIT